MFEFLNSSSILFNFLLSFFYIHLYIIGFNWTILRYKKKAK